MDDTRIEEANPEKETGQIIRIDQEHLTDHLGKIVRGTVEETLNALLEAEADRLCQASRYERTETRKDTRAGHHNRKLASAAGIVEKGIEETLNYYYFPSQHWRSLRTNNPLERLMREIRRRTRVVGSFPDGQSALMLVAARLRHVASTKWGTTRYLNMDRLKEMMREIA